MASPERGSLKGLSRTSIYRHRGEIYKSKLEDCEYFKDCTVVENETNDVELQFFDVPDDDEEMSVESIDAGVDSCLNEPQFESDVPAYLKGKFCCTSINLRPQSYHRPMCPIVCTFVFCSF